MGMYNEVSHICPRCALRDVRSYGQGQVSQIGPGFGGYCLSDLSQLKRNLEDKDLTPDQLKRIASCATDVWFSCDKGDGHQFQADPAVLLAVAMLADRFVVDTTNDTLSRATDMLKELYPD
jgi:hypothetical protein